MMLPHASKIPIAVLYGGRSAEHEISILTALQAIEAIDPIQYIVIPVYVALSGKWFTGKKLLEKSCYRSFEKQQHLLQEVCLLPNPTIQGLLLCKDGYPTQEKIAISACFLAFHGQQGEDGCIQGLLELAELPYTGCGVTTSAVAMHKQYCKALLHQQGIPVLPGTLVTKAETLQSLSETCKRILRVPELSQFPLFVKPCSLGSSIGIGVARNEPTLKAALANVFQYEDTAIVEPYVQELIEINISVLDGDPPIASVVEIPIASAGVGALSYEDKYLRGDKTGGGMANLSRIINPIELSDEIKQAVTQHALHAFTFLRCSGVVRFDFMWDKPARRLYFNELNPIPGSLAFYLWEASSPPLLYTEIINRLLVRARTIRGKKLSFQRDVELKESLFG